MDRVTDDGEADLKEETMKRVGSVVSALSELETTLQLQDEGAAQLDKDMEKAAEPDKYAHLHAKWDAEFNRDMAEPLRKAQEGNVYRIQSISKSNECEHDWRPTGMFLMAEDCSRMMGIGWGPKVESCSCCGLLRLLVREGAAEIQVGKLG